MMKNNEREHKSDLRSHWRCVNTRTFWSQGVERKQHSADSSACRSNGSQYLRGPLKRSFRASSVDANIFQWKDRPQDLIRKVAKRPSCSVVSSMRIFAALAFCALLILLVSLPAFAAGGMIDDFQGKIQGDTSKWMTRSLAVANWLFSFLMVTSFVTAVVRYVSLNHTLEGVGHMFMDFFIKVIPLYVILSVASTVLPQITDLAVQLGGQITGTSVSVKGPSEIFGLGLALGGQVVLASLTPYVISGLASGIPIVSGVAADFGTFTMGVGFITALVTIISFALIAIEYFCAFVQAYITLSIGAFSLGWMASSGTKHMAQGYLAAAWASVIRVMMTIACCSLIVGLEPSLIQFTGSLDPTAIITGWFTLIGISIFSALIAIKLPSFAANAFSGQLSVSAGDVAGLVMRAARGKS
jgi:hypothetical protein